MGTARRHELPPAGESGEEDGEILVRAWRASER
jgi:hypothetical protein